MQTLVPVEHAQHTITCHASKASGTSRVCLSEPNQPALRTRVSPSCHVRCMARESIRCHASSDDPTPSRATDGDPFDFRTRARTELWREEIGGSFDNLDTAQMAEEVQRLEKRQKLERLKAGKSDETTESSNQYGEARAAFDKFLVADFFFIIAILGWFVVGVLQKQITEDTSLLDAWLPLWMPVIQPALGVFMGAALFSAFQNWRRQKSK